MHRFSFIRRLAPRDPCARGSPRERSRSARRTRGMFRYLNRLAIRRAGGSVLCISDACCSFARFYSNHPLPHPSPYCAPTELILLRVCGSRELGNEFPAVRGAENYKRKRRKGRRSVEEGFEQSSRSSRRIESPTPRAMERV